MPALAGPPFTCHVFDIGSAKSLPWGAHNNWLGTRDDYDVKRVVADTEALLTPSTPTLVRMETLRRATIYVSRDRAAAEQLLAAVMSRVKAADDAGRPDAMAIFDAGYVVEALGELEQMGTYTKQLAGVGRVLAGITRPFEALTLLEKSAALRPGDASIQFALALLMPATDKTSYLRQAREGARQDACSRTTLQDSKCNRKGGLHDQLAPTDGGSDSHQPRDSRGARRCSAAARTGARHRARVAWSRAGTGR